MAYARQMGHTHVIYCQGMENSPLAEGMYFYFNDPEFSLRRLALDFNRKYSEKEIDRIQKSYVVASPEKAFPENMATSWYEPPNFRNLTLDFQQQKVIDDTVRMAADKLKSIESRRPGFRAAGFSWDEPKASGNFRLPPKLDVADVHKAQGRNVTLAHWTGRGFFQSVPGLHARVRHIFGGEARLLRRPAARGVEAQSGFQAHRGAVRNLRKLDRHGASGARRKDGAARQGRL